jgi:outer membrane protein assembly factor BamE (lipoprotein component of BamABCDE complex)
MKKIILTTALTGLFSLSFTANQGLILAQSPQTTQTQSTIIAVAKVGLGKIRPGMSEQQVRSILGKPTLVKTEFSPGVGDNILSLQYPDISL